MASVSKRLATDETLMLLVNAVNNTETVKQAKAEIQAEGTAQVNNVMSTAEEMVKDINQVPKNTADIADINSNLADLEYSENSGSGNIFRGNTKSNPQYVGDFYQQPQTHDYSFDSNSNFNGFIVEVKPNTKYYSIYAFGIISFLDENKTLIGGNEQLFYYDGTGFITTPENCKYVRFSCSKGSTHNYAIFEGDKVREYEPYIPSVKMLAEENAQQNTEAMDLKMLGWTVPTECPIQNEISGNQFIQKVGRIDLSTLSFSELGNFGYYVVIPTSKAPINISTVANIYLEGFTTVKRIDLDSSPNSIAMTGSKEFCINNGKIAIPSGYLYYELETPITMTIDGNEAVTKIKNDLTQHEITVSVSDWGQSGNIYISTIEIPEQFRNKEILSITQKANFSGDEPTWLGNWYNSSESHRILCFSSTGTPCTIRILLSFKN